MLSFSDVLLDSDLIKEANISFAPNSPTSKVLSFLLHSNSSMSIDQIVANVGGTKTDIKKVINYLYENGTIYDEQKDYYTLTQYGKAIAAHAEISPPPTDAYDYTIANKRSINQLFNAFSSSPTKSLTSEEIQTIIGTSAALQTAFQTLISKGYLRPTDDGYALSSLGDVYTTHTRGVSKQLDADIIATLDYIEKTHPEYDYIYQIIKKSKESLSREIATVKVFMNGGTTSTKKGEEFFGGKDIPAFAKSIEAAVLKSIQLIAYANEHLQKRIPPMSDVQLGRNYVDLVIQKATVAKVSQLLTGIEKGSTVSTDTLFDIAQKIVGQEFPETLNKDSAKNVLAQAIASKRDINTGIFLPSDRAENIAPILRAFLTSGLRGGVKAFNTYTSANNSPAINESLELVFNKASFAGTDLRSMSLGGQEITFNETDFSGNCNLSNVKMPNCIFQRCNLETAKIVGADITGDTFRECNLQNADFNNSIGLANKNTKFEDNTGKPLNFHAISGENTGKQVRTQVVKQDIRTYYATPLNEEEKELAREMAETLRSHVYKTAEYSLTFPHTSDLLTFSELDVSSEEKKTAINALLQPNPNPPAWLTKDILLQMIKSGELAQLGFDPRKNGKLIGILTQLEAERQAPASRYEEALEGVSPKQQEQQKSIRMLQGVLNSYPPNAPILAEDIIRCLPATATDIQGMVKAYGEHLTPHQLEELSLALSRAGHYVSNDLSNKVKEFKENKINNFAYTSRISLFHNKEHGDRNTMSGQYPESFAIVLEPSKFGVTDPDVRKMVDALTIHDQWRKGEEPPTGHFRHIVAAARITTFQVSERDILSGNNSTKNVWVLVELQSDPYQYVERLGKAVDPDWQPMGGDSTTKEETRQFLQPIAELSGNVPKEIPYDALVGYFGKQPAYVKKTYSELLKEYGIDENGNEATALKMFMVNSVLPAVNFLDVNEALEKGIKKYTPLPGGGIVITSFVRHGLVDPIFENDGTPAFNTADYFPKLRDTLQMFNKFKFKNPAKLTKAYSEVLENLIKDKAENLLQDKKLGKVTDTGVSLTPYGLQTNRVFGAFRKFREHYSDWSEMLILELINRAIEAGNVDELWLVSADRFKAQLEAKHEDTARASHYDPVEQKFTNETIPPPFEIKDTGSALWSNASSEYYPNKYYVIRIKDWESQRRSASLKFFASAYTNFIVKYIDQTNSKYPYTKFIPHDKLVESALAYLKSTGQLNDANILNEAVADANTEFGTHLVENDLTNYVLIIVNILKGAQKNLLKLVLKTGEEPRRLIDDVVKAFLEKFFPNLSSTTVLELNAVINRAITDPETYAQFFKEAQEAYDRMREEGTSGEGGDQLESVAPHGESMPGEEDDLSGEKQENPPEEVPEVKFDKPSKHEMGNILQGEIDSLLDKMNKATTPEEKERYRRQLHELSTLGSLRFDIISLSSMEVLGHVEHRNGKWVVLNKKRTKVLGTHPTKEKADAQLRAIEMHKHMGSISELKFGANDLEFTQNRERNNFFQYEPGNSGKDLSPDGGGGSVGDELGNKFDNSSRDMHDGFYTDIGTNDIEKKKKERTTLDWNESDDGYGTKENLQLGFASLIFDATKPKAPENE